MKEFFPQKCSFIFVSAQKMHKYEKICGNKIEGSLRWYQGWKLFSTSLTFEKGE
jgi:hypothetical protein